MGVLVEEEVVAGALGGEEDVLDVGGEGFEVLGVGGLFGAQVGGALGGGGVGVVVVGCRAEGFREERGVGGGEVEVDVG